MPEIRELCLHSETARSSSSGGGRGGRSVSETDRGGQQAAGQQAAGGWTDGRSAADRVQGRGRIADSSPGKPCAPHAARSSMERIPPSNQHHPVRRAFCLVERNGWPFAVRCGRSVGGRAAEPLPRVRSCIDHTCPCTFSPSVRTHVVAVCVGSVLQTVLSNRRTARGGPSLSPSRQPCASTGRRAQPSHVSTPIEEEGETKTKTTKDVTATAGDYKQHDNDTRIVCFALLKQWSRLFGARLNKDHCRDILVSTIVFH